MAVYVATSAAPAVAAALSLAPPAVGGGVGGGVPPAGLVGAAGAPAGATAAAAAAAAAFGAVLTTQALGFGITGVGSAVGEGDTLGRLNRLRYVLHAAAPAMIPVAYAVACRCGLPLAGGGGGAAAGVGAGGGGVGGLSASSLLAGHWAVAAALAAVTLVAALRVELAPVRAFGVLRYVAPGESDVPTPGGTGGRLRLPSRPSSASASAGTRRGSVAFWLVGNAAELAYLGGMLWAAHLSGGFFL
ncbi:hypothetical protein BU14_1006s0003 [Porphyra umbilicalis]|uniref:Uncharacterized protein n=1 Tax=Porphyra umbilicalis TaxID=2786 RepID=A0A1X6NMV7_PORUM|nr:hypothetical protein BU14_1006s0003 [Porphyra umbilicalis]|eukprot:OSX69928.1 hypothetical protein BU14_1006s0003 [Porphyra umbilicalis]